MGELTISGARVVTPGGVVLTDVVIDGAKMRLGGAEGQSARGSIRVGARGAAKSRPQRLDGRGLYLLPGFVDIHTHGYDGFDFTLGVYDAATDSFDSSREKSLAALARYVGRMPSRGLTSVYLATLAQPVNVLRERFNLLRDYMKSPAAGTRVLGGFLEGTFINEKMAGAQNPELVFGPDLKVFDTINEAGVIRLALVAPDRGEPAYALMRHLKRRGIVVGAGHTDATAEQMALARQAGLRYVVHFLNGPTGHSFKPFHGGGAVEATLSDPRCYAEIIADGYHVNPRYVRDVLARKGYERIIAVSDAMFAAGAAGLRSFQIGGVYGKVSPDGKYLSVANNPRALFGSCLDLGTAFGNLVNWLTREMEGVWVARHAAVPLDEAVAAAVQMTSTNSCRLVGLDKKPGLGQIADGCPADLVLARLKGKRGDYHLEVERTWVAGQEVYRRE